jgi:hypothetical protein
VGADGLLRSASRRGVSGAATPLLGPLPLVSFKALQFVFESSLSALRFFSDKTLLAEGGPLSCSRPSFDPFGKLSSLVVRVDGRVGGVPSPPIELSTEFRN